MLVKFILFIILACSLSVLLLVICVLVTKSNLYVEKLTAYECGFDPYGDARNNFHISFYLIALLFLIFDLEGVFLFPFVSQFYLITQSGFFFFLDFFIELIVGFIYIWLAGAFEWSLVSKDS